MLPANLHGTKRDQYNPPETTYHRQQIDTHSSGLTAERKLPCTHAHLEAYVMR